MSKKGEIFPEFNGLTKDLINFPRELKELQYELDFEDEDDEIEYLSFDQCKNLMDSICGIGDLLVNKGAAKFKLRDPNVEGSEWCMNYRNLVNGARRAGGHRSTGNTDEDVTNTHQGTNDVQEALPKPSTSSVASVKISARTSSRIKAAALVKPPIRFRKPAGKKKARIPPDSTTIAKLPALFIMLKEIRKLGCGMFRMKNHNVQQSLKILPQLKGITMGQLEDFYGNIFGECLENDVESQRDYIRRYHQILESLPDDPAGVIKGTNPRACGLLIPYIHSFDNVQINNDEDFTGLELDRVEGALLRYHAGKSKGKKIGRVTGINNAMLFFGVAGSPFPEHVEDGNAIGSINYMPRGVLKFWRIVLARYCKDIRRNVQLVLKKLMKEGLEEDLRNEADMICILQHKHIILTPLFYNNCAPHPIPCKIFMQRRSELMVIGSGVHHGGASGGEGGTAGRATNIITPDYHLAFPIDLKQCDGHGIYKRRFILFADDIELFRVASIELYNRGVKKKMERAVLEAVDNCRRIMESQVSRSVQQIGTSLPSTSGVCTVQGTSTVRPIMKDASTTTSRKRPGPPQWKRSKVRVVRKLSEKFKCPKCGSKFHQNNDLEKHISHNSCSKDNKCDNCGKTYVFYLRLVNHRKSCCVISDEAD